MKKKTMVELNRLSTQEYKKIGKLPVVVVLDKVRSAMNVGSVFRTADAFLIEKICLCGITAVPPMPEIHKTALGAEDSVEWEHFSNTVDAVQVLRDKGYKICSVEQVKGSVSLEQFIVSPNEKYALVLGNEVKGVEQQVVDASDYCIEIPQFGTKHSLNIANTAAIVMWNFFSEMKLKNC